MKKKNTISIYSSFILGVLLIIATSCRKDEVPVLTTAIVTDISITSAIGGGKITSDGGTEVTEHGICWSLSKTPTLDDNKTTEGAGFGSFTSIMTGLTKNTTYYVRAYATNMVGTAFGDEKVFTTYGLEDIDGNRYHTIKIGTQEWMQKNLKTTLYRDGSDIPNITSSEDWGNLSTAAYCDFDNDSSNMAIYGRLYNWFAVTDAHNICPAGWHVPSDYEWDVLINTLGGENVAGGKMKSTGSVDNGDGLWHSANVGGTNESGFTGLPGGQRADYNGGVPFIFTDLHSYGHWWSSNGNSSYASFLRLQDSHTRIEKFINFSRNGKSVRCIKD